MPDIAELKNIPLLSHLSAPELEALARVAEDRTFPAGATIFTEGSEGDSLFLVLSGAVRVSKMTRSGEAKAIATLGPGGFFGEMALFDDYVRSATVSALSHVRTFAISKDAFMAYISSGAAGASKLALEIMRALAPRIRQTNRELVALYEAGRIIGEHSEPGEMLSNLLGVLADATSCTRGAAFLLNTAAGRLECRAAFGYEADPSSWAEPLEGGIAEEVIRSESALIIEDFSRAPRFASVQRIGYEAASMMGAALRAQGQAIGTIILCDKVASGGTPISFTAGDANLLAGLAAQASGAIESARLHEEAREKEKLDRVYFRY